MRREDTKLVALALWERLGAPVYDSPEEPEEGFSRQAIEMAKRGRRRTEETAACGSNRARKSLRDYERSALKHGDLDAEIGRLSEYPMARRKYANIMKGLKECIPP